MTQDFQQIVNDLKKRIFYPVYLLSGEEPYYIDQLSDLIEDTVLSDNEKEFNQNILYGRDVDARTIVEHAKRYPMMASHQVIIVKEAQEIKDLEDLKKYVEQPLKTTILVICHKYKKYDKRTSLAKQVIDKGVFYVSDKLYDDRIPAWINNRVNALGYRITGKASSMMADALGANLQKIDGELHKLFINIPSGSEITETEVEKYIGISKDYNVFELQDALATGNVLKSNRIVNYIKNNPKDNSLMKNLPILFSFFSKLMLFHTVADRPQPEITSVMGISPGLFYKYRQAARHYPPSRLARVIAIFHEFDKKNKGIGSVSTSEGELLKELTYRILHS
ncbi:MAG: DNA polymerase III subunit delta [Lentimicrobium sp.]|jgi:DNA polymerase-3 subunit delta|nr:DNA polymerase III subunit delta [Lentimicrobium sp.]MDD2528548.1 DNA polymerase III subunit delta [Lentimicrobiaceae bacterium]MDD4596525.1 DNA polymerase III subunit delta [Lentimicrobiaceae bacterium]MDY0026683.1 DNA polymerase III subunit delta [Lentimicrobium sp.]HAH57886.1 DNA polymerase III subunit delta [Bacteroidales bacterium]